MPPDRVAINFNGDIEGFIKKSSIKYHLVKKAVSGSETALNMLPPWVRIGIRKARKEINAREQNNT